jgi:hypothetical protein
LPVRFVVLVPRPSLAVDVPWAGRAVLAGGVPVVLPGVFVLPLVRPALLLVPLPLVVPPVRLPPLVPLLPPLAPLPPVPPPLPPLPPVQADCAWRVVAHATESISPKAHRTIV